MTGYQKNDADLPSWLGACWFSLSERERGILAMRARGETLQAIGDVYGFSRERARQIVRDCDAAMHAAAASSDPSFLSRIKDAIDSRLAVTGDTIADLLPATPLEARLALLKSYNISHPKTWDGELFNWWTNDPEALDKKLSELAGLLPLPDDEMATAMADLGLDVEPLAVELLNSPNSKLLKHELGWIRSNRRSRDIAFLWLQSQGSPRPSADIAAVTGAQENTIRETMRRDSAFSQVRPDGLWALTDWRVPGADRRYSNAEEVVMEVLRDSGPLEFNALKTEVRNRYPVGDWRITQCLNYSLIGRTADGKYDLVERGAQPIEATEPRRPSNVQASGSVVGVRLPVNHDMLRGSGIAVNQWLPWFLGLRLAPSIRRFEIDLPPGEVVVKRATGTATISSLRAAVQSMDLVEGCKVVLMLDTATDTAKLVHACPGDDCPAFSDQGENSPLPT